MTSNTHFTCSANSDDRHPPPSLVLEICSGRTHFPLRPVRSARFLIGAGDGCDLQLGGDDMPPLHSILHVNEAGALLETVALTPPLKVNGLAVESVMLEPGDRISIGPFELLAHRFSPDSEDVSADSVSASGPAELNEELIESGDVADLSAAELVELIEREERMVEEFEQRRQLGTEALLDAIGERIESTLGDSAEPHDESADRLNRVLAQVNKLSVELERRARRLAEREAEYARTTAIVFEEQQVLTARMESLLAQFAALEAGRSYPKVA